MKLSIGFPAASTPMLDASGAPVRAWADFLRNLWSRTGGGAGPALSVSVLTLTAAPTAAHIAPGEAALVKNTTTGFVALYYNDGGAMKSALLT